MLQCLDTNGIPMVDTSTGVVIPLVDSSSPLNIPNNPTYSNDINLAFNVGGALADISWLEAGDIPIVSFHCEKDQYAPIDTGVRYCSNNWRLCSRSYGK